MNEYPQGIWNATEYFKHLTATNRLAKSEGFTFCSVSGLDGFEEALDHMQRSKAFICVSDIANGYTELHNTPRTRRVKTVFLAMRHRIDDMRARNTCMVPSVHEQAHTGEDETGEPLHLHRPSNIVQRD